MDASSPGGQQPELFLRGNDILMADPSQLEPKITPVIFEI